VVTAAAAALCRDISTVAMTPSDANQTMARAVIMRRIG
jgi:hypothetical protein